MNLIKSTNNYRKQDTIKEIRPKSIETTVCSHGFIINPRSMKTKVDVP